MPIGTEFQVQKVRLHCPTLEQVAKVLEDGLRNNFEDAKVTVVECPDLTKKPFNLASPGLCGSPRIADVGGVPNLVPLVKKDKIYNLEKVAELCELPGAFVVGAGAGPWHIVGCNSENGGYKLKQSPTTDFCLMANLFMSEGLPGKVLEVKTGRRTGKGNFVSTMRTSLASYYGNRPVALGGMFCVEQGKLKTHVMPNFSQCPLESDEAMDNWLEFFEMSGPFNCLGVLISHDPDLDLRIEHFHGYNENGQGGHYHQDTTPDDVKYCGYFNVPQYIYRIDRPLETHMIGRD